MFTQKTLRTIITLFVAIALAAGTTLAATPRPTYGLNWIGVHTPGDTSYPVEIEVTKDLWHAASFDVSIVGLDPNTCVNNQNQPLVVTGTAPLYTIAITGTTNQVSRHVSCTAVVSANITSTVASKIGVFDMPTSLPVTTTFGAPSYFQIPSGSIRTVNVKVSDRAGTDFSLNILDGTKITATQTTVYNNQTYTYNLATDCTNGSGADLICTVNAAQNATFGDLGSYVQLRISDSYAAYSGDRPVNIGIIVP